jgi:hypothetical protein
MENKSLASNRNWNSIFIALGLNLALIWFLIIRIEPVLQERLSTIEIVVLFFYPLFIFYLRNDWAVRKWAPYVVVLTIVIVITDPILHESSHVLGLYAIGSKPIGFQLIPKFWHGEFQHGGWVRSDYIAGWRGPIPGLAPYMKDILLLTVGWFIFKRRKINNVFMAGFVFVFFFLSPAFDIINNYSIKLIGNVEGNDFHGASLGWGEFYANSIGILFSIYALSTIIWVLIIYKQFPKDSSENS